MFFYFTSIFSVPVVAETFICTPERSVEYYKEKFKDNISGYKSGPIFVDLKNEKIDKMTWQPYVVINGIVNEWGKISLNCNVSYGNDTLECWSDWQLERENNLSTPNNMAYNIMIIEPAFDINNISIKLNPVKKPEVIKRMRYNGEDKISKKRSKKLIQFTYSRFIFKHDGNDRSYSGWKDHYGEYFCE